MRDRGSMLVLTVFVGVAVTLAVLVAVGPVVGALRDQQRARTAADAAALAGVIEGRSAASAVAVANGAELVGWVVDGDRVTVVVDVDGHRATARATDAP